MDSTNRMPTQSWTVVDGGRGIAWGGGYEGFTCGDGCGGSRRGRGRDSLRGGHRRYRCRAAGSDEGGLRHGVAKIVSNSYGGDEYTGVLADGQAYYSRPGVAMVVSSGDYGFGPASFPASWNRAIAVGGTTVTRTATGWSQSAWEGAGSGCSAWVAKPRWQKDPNCLMRTVPDVSALADPATGFAVYDTYGLDQFGLPPGWLVVGGTSLAAPLVAGMIGLAGDPEDLSTASRLYSRSARRGLLDVVGGSNAVFNDCGGDYLCTGVVGYDGPTGVGTPVGISAL